MNILICDDQPEFARRIGELTRTCLARQGITPEMVVCTGAAEALAAAERVSFQLALLDVDLGATSGIALGRMLRQKEPGLVLVYISAYLEFAPEGYTVNAFRYLLKRDVERTLPDCLEEVLAEHSRTLRTLSVRQGRTVREIPLEEIYYLESDLRKINVYGAEPYKAICSYYAKLADLPEDLPEYGFLRVSRSDMVNMKYIHQLSGYQLTLSNGVELGVSRNGYAAIRSAYLEWKGQFGDVD